ncbi:MAG: hypothetical protein RR620_08665 [Clostridium sp.]
MELTFNAIIMRKLIYMDDFLRFAYKALNESSYSTETDNDRLLTLFKYHVVGDSKLTNAYIELSK